jgi:hypothetical protein
MLHHQFDADKGVLILSPDGPLAASDFVTISREIDPHIAMQGSLKGILLHAKKFPGWENLESAIAHMRFVESHHQKIQRLAVVSDNRWLTELPKIATHIVHPKVEHFSEAQYDKAMHWLESATSTET